MNPTTPNPASLAMYSDLAEWWPLLSAPADYAEEADWSVAAIRAHGTEPLRRMVEFGSGGGNNALWLKAAFDLVLVDLSPDMLAVSRRMNPECVHHVGDMRTVRLGETFDVVYVHDAVMYLTTVDDLRAAMATAAAHCRPGGVAVFQPDCVRETFAPETDHGGHDSPDGDGRALRYLEWSWDPDPADTHFVADYTIVRRFADGTVDVRHDRHLNGLFPRQTWSDCMAEAGFDARVVVDDWKRDVFIGVRREA